MPLERIVRYVKNDDIMKVASKKEKSAYPNECLLQPDGLKQQLSRSLLRDPEADLFKKTFDKEESEKQIINIGYPSSLFVSSRTK